MKFTLSLSLFALLFLAGCAGRRSATDPPAPPLPPEIVLGQLNAEVAVINDTFATAIDALAARGIVPADQRRVLIAWSKGLARVNKAVSAQINASTVPWADRVVLIRQAFESTAAPALGSLGTDYPLLADSAARMMTMIGQMIEFLQEPAQ